MPYLNACMWASPYTSCVAGTDDNIIETKRFACYPHSWVVFSAESNGELVVKWSDHSESSVATSALYILNLLAFALRRIIYSFIPEETQVSPWPYAVHRNPNNFSPIPDVFWPDRWLAQESYTLPSGKIIPADQVITTREVFMPFSLGPYICAGKPLAIIELRAVVCGIVQQCDVRVADGFDLESWNENLREVFVTMRGKLEVVVTMRGA